MKKEIISTILYVIAIVSFIIYLSTKNSAYMACGGLLMIGASLILIFSRKNKK